MMDKAMIIEGRNPEFEKCKDKVQKVIGDYRYDRTYGVYANALYQMKKAGILEGNALSILGSIWEESLTEITRKAKENILEEDHY